MGANMKIDYDKCIGCHQCIEDCLTHYLGLDEVASSDTFNKPIIMEKRRCISCGHCMAICPVEAIEFEDNQFIPIDDDAILKLFGKKRTVRRYKKGAKIDNDILDKIIIAAQSAPAPPYRKTRIIIIEEKLEEIYNKALDYLVSIVEKDGSINPMYATTMELHKKRDEVLWNAQYLVMIVGGVGTEEDGVIAAERMQIMAEALGVGTAYRGDMKMAINAESEIRDMVGLKKRESVLTAFAMGIPDFNFFREAIKKNKTVTFI
ncbi:MAG: nitroreductase family protein [Lachnospiraceae bacterium]|nr:nitroreductase family protein [Lachnospiraceae bacterium]